MMYCKSVSFSGVGCRLVVRGTAMGGALTSTAAAAAAAATRSPRCPAAGRRKTSMNMGIHNVNLHVALEQRPFFHPTAAPCPSPICSPKASAPRQKPRVAERMSPRLKVTTTSIRQ